MTTSTVVQRMARAAVGVLAASLIAVPVTPAFASAGPPGNSWDTATAVFTDTTGKQTTVKANSVSHCYTHSITLSGTQNIPFENMRRFEVTHSDETSKSDGKADLAVTILDGRTLTGTVRADCDFFGDNEVGRFTLSPQALKSVEFHRSDDPAKAPPAPAGGIIEIKIQFGDKITLCRITVPPAPQPPVVDCPQR